jgi:hypothetical protein
MRYFRASSAMTASRSCLFSNCFNLRVLLRDTSVQVLPLQLGELGGEQPAIAFNVSAMAPHLGRTEVNHPPSPLWGSSVLLLIVGPLVYRDSR